MIEIREAARWYGQVIALTDITLSLGPGVTGLLGPNGAGKSTLLRLLTGQLAPSRGTVEILGERVWQNRALYRRIGYCPEHEGNYEDLTGLEVVTFLTRLHGFGAAEAERRAKELLVRLDLEGAMHRRLSTYSKGMRQRVKLAQALAHDPDVLFLDEPLTGCDPIARVRVLNVIKEAANGKRCIVVSSHVLHEIESLTSEVVLIHRGKVLAEGDIYAIRALIDQHPHKVRIGCDRPRDLGCALAPLSHVLTLNFESEALTLETSEPDRLYDEVPEAAERTGVTLFSLTSPDNNLAAVFQYLTEQRGGARAERS